MNVDIQALIDRGDITQLCARMAHLLNDQKIDELLDCYVDGGTFQIGDAPPVAGRDGMRALMRSMPGVIHMTLDVVVEIDGDVARTDSHLLATWAQRHQADNGFLYSGRYQDLLRRTESGWRMDKRKLLLDRSGAAIGKVIAERVGFVESHVWREERVGRAREL